MWTGEHPARYNCEDPDPNRRMDHVGRTKKGAVWALIGSTDMAYTQCVQVISVQHSFIESLCLLILI